MGHAAVGPALHQLGSKAFMLVRYFYLELRLIELNLILSIPHSFN